MFNKSKYVICSKEEWIFNIEYLTPLYVDKIIILYSKKYPLEIYIKLTYKFSYVIIWF
jgi:hypothetical protein